MNTLKVKCVLLKAVLPCLQNPILINGEFLACLLLICKVGWYRQENCLFCLRNIFSGHRIGCFLTMTVTLC